MQRALPIVLENRRQQNRNAYVRNVATLAMTSKTARNTVMMSNNVSFAKQIKDQSTWSKINTLLLKLQQWYNHVLYLRQTNVNTNVNNNARSVNSRLDWIESRAEEVWEQLARLLGELAREWLKLSETGVLAKKLDRALMECQKVFAMEPFDGAVRDAFLDADSRRHVSMNNTAASIEHRLAWRLEKAIMVAINMRQNGAITSRAS